jgi:hypothetical protein
MAAGDHIYTGAQLATKTEGGRVIAVTDDKKGTDSATECGSNSRYYVTWSISTKAQQAMTMKT